VGAWAAEPPARLLRGTNQRPQAEALLRRSALKSVIRMFQLISQAQAELATVTDEVDQASILLFT
jgi:hypothetical protein